MAQIFTFQAVEDPATNRTALTSLLGGSVRTYLLANPDKKVIVELRPHTNGLVEINTNTGGISLSTLVSGVTAGGGNLEMTSNGAPVRLRLNTFSNNMGQFLFVTGLNKVTFNRMRFEFLPTEKRIVEGTITGTATEGSFTEFQITPKEGTSLVDVSLIPEINRVLVVSDRNKVAPGDLRYIPSAADADPTRFEDGKYVVPLKGATAAALSVGQTVVISDQHQGNQIVTTRLCDTVSFLDCEFVNVTSSVVYAHNCRELTIDGCSVYSTEAASFFCSGSDFCKMYSPRFTNGPPVVRYNRNRILGVLGDDFINVHSRTFVKTATGETTVTVRPISAEGTFESLGLDDVILESTRIASFDNDGYLEHVITSPVDYSAVTYVPAASGSLDITVDDPSSVKDYVTFMWPATTRIEVVGNYLNSCIARFLLLNPIGGVEAIVRDNTIRGLGGPFALVAGEMQFFGEVGPQHGNVLIENNLIENCNSGVTEKKALFFIGAEDTSGLLPRDLLRTNYTIQNNRFGQFDGLFIDHQSEGNLLVAYNEFLSTAPEARYVRTSTPEKVVSDVPVISGSGAAPVDPSGDLVANQNQPEQFAPVNSKAVQSTLNDTDRPEWASRRLYRQGGSVR